MTPQQFDEQMARIRGAFGTKPYDSPQRVELIWNAVQLVDYADFVAMVSTMIGSMRKPPIPLDFAESAKSKRRYVANNSAPMGVTCDRCHDLGLLRVVDVEQKLDSLVLCSCDQGSRQAWKLPKINAKIQKAFTVARLPDSWFKPDEVKAGSDSKIVIDGVTRKMGEIRNRVNKAQEFWAEWGAIFDDAPDNYMRDR